MAAEAARRRLRSSKNIGGSTSPTGARSIRTGGLLFNLSLSQLQSLYILLSNVYRVYIYTHTPMRGLSTLSLPPRVIPLLCLSPSVCFPDFRSGTFDSSRAATRMRYHRVGIDCGTLALRATGAGACCPCVRVWRCPARQPRTADVPSRPRSVRQHMCAS